MRNGWETSLYPSRVPCVKDGVVLRFYRVQPLLTVTRQSYFGVTTMPTLTLTIVPYGAMTSYRVCGAQGRLIFATRAYSTSEGTQGARERLRAWCKATGHKLVMAPGEQRKAG